MSSAALEVSSLAVETLVVEPDPAASPYRRILVPTDGGALAHEAVVEALKLASRIGAATVFLTVSEPFHVPALDAAALDDARADYERETGERADRILAEAGDAALEAGVPFLPVHRWGAEPYLEIIDTARELGCDLIAMASHGRKGFSAIVLGSVTNKVLTHSVIPVLVCRRPREPRPEATRALDAAYASAGVA